MSASLDLLDSLANDFHYQFQLSTDAVNKKYCIMLHSPFPGSPNSSSNNFHVSKMLAGIVITAPVKFLDEVVIRKALNLWNEMNNAHREHFRALTLYQESSRFKCFPLTSLVRDEDKVAQRYWNSFQLLLEKQYAYETYASGNEISIQSIDECDLEMQRLKMTTEQQ